MSLKSQSNLRTNSLQYLVNEPLNVLKLIMNRILWIEIIEISFSNIFWQKKYIEKLFTITLQYLENELRHLCPLNPIQTPENSFRWVQKWVAPSMSLKSQSNLRTNSLQYLVNEPLNVWKLIVDRILWIEMIEISFFNIFWQKYIEKNYNCIAIPWKWVAPSMSLFGTSMAQLPSFCQQRSRRFKTKF